MKNQIKDSRIGGYTVLVFTIVGMLALVAVLQPAEAKQPETLLETNYFAEGYGDLSPRLYIADSAHMHSAGEEFIVEVRTDSQDTLINAVNARLGYSEDSLEFVAAEVSESAFAIEAQTSVENGIITLARGHIGGVSGDQLVAKLRFRARTQVESSASIQPIIPQSALLKHDDSSNVL